MPCGLPSYTETRHLFAVADARWAVRRDASAHAGHTPGVTRHLLRERAEDVHGPAAEELRHRLQHIASRFLPDLLRVVAAR